MGITIKTYDNPADLRHTISATFDDAVGREMPGAILREIVAKIAGRYVEENYDKIVSAVGNEAVLDAVSESVRKKVGEILGGAK